jgi:hypothetical protein
MKFFLSLLNVCLRGWLSDFVSVFSETCLWNSGIKGPNMGWIHGKISAFFFLLMLQTFWRSNTHLKYRIWKQISEIFLNTKDCTWNGEEIFHLRALAHVWGRKCCWYVTRTSTRGVKFEPQLSRIKNETQNIIYTYSKLVTNVDEYKVTAFKW